MHGNRQVWWLLRDIGIICAAVLFISSVTGYAAKEFVRPVARPAATYPAHDAHPDEGVTVAVDPYDVPEKAQIFTTNYGEQGLLPVLVIISNDSDQPVSLTDMKAQFRTADRTKIPPSDADGIYRRLAHPKRNDSPSYPLPFPRKKAKGAVNQKTMDEIQAAMFSARAVEPHSTQSGFMFFDVSGISAPLAGANFYLTGVRNSKGNDLMYFEVQLEKYLTAPTR